MKWTTNQSLAINTEGNNIIVSAGAGSGKTAVLTERVITKLLNGTHINELLILTFTNNAAFEMKSRIKKALINQPKLKEEIDLIESADITTFDAFTLALVKKYHYYLNLNPNISIVDSSIINKKKKDYINTIFSNLYDEDNKDFNNFILAFNSKSDRQTKSTILELDNKLDLLINKEDYLNNYVNKYYDINNIESLFTEFEKTIINKITVIKTLMYNLTYEVDSSFMIKMEESLNGLLNANDYETIRSSVNNIKLPRISNSTDKGKYYKSQISDIISSLKKETAYSKEYLINNLLETKEYVAVIIDILIKLNKYTTEFKQKHNLYEFNDISKMAIYLVKNYDDVRNNLKYYYKEIMIDEYQDTSDMQEEFVSQISNNNVYMVGDVKQSIYRFRNANPNIFKNKYEDYKRNVNGIKIDLNENFRSRKEVLDSINDIFIHIMDNFIGNANYKADHQLIFGNKSFAEEGNNNQNNNLEIYNYENNNNYTKEEIEAFIIANDIKSKIDNKYLVFDKELRPCTYQDFCILIDRTKSFDIFKKIFDYLNIPLNIYKDDDILLSEEVLLINNIISFIINIKNHETKNNRLYFASIARSYLFDYDDEYIYQNINNISNTPLYTLCKGISQNIDNISNEELLDIIIDKFDFYNKFVKVGNILYRSAIIDNLKEKFAELNKADIYIEEIPDYLNSLIEDEESIKIPGIISHNDSVTITNIHKSKGLEYKICYYPLLHKEFNTMDIKKRIIFSKEYGFIIPNYKEGYISTFISILNKDKYNIDEISERIRLFYVALTRAKEKMIMVTSLKESNNIYDENGLVDLLTRLSYKSYTSILNSVSNYINNYITQIEVPFIDLNYKKIRNKSLDKLPKKDPIKVNEKEFSCDIINSKRYSKQEYNISNETDYQNELYGTHMHYILETLNFNNPNYTLYNKQETEVINNLLNQELFSNIQKAKIYREYEFTYNDNNTQNRGIIDLILEYNDHIDIIDYKLKNTLDDAYKVQLNGYKKYLETITNKPINTYLYSLLDHNIKKIN